MIIQCNSCEKRFVVPDNAITAEGRLVQCSSCGNKWTQYPNSKEKEKPQKQERKNIQTKVENITIPKKVSIQNKKVIKKRKKIKQAYTREYLKIKHGISLGKENNKNSKIVINTKKHSYGFYNYLITTSIFLIFIFGLIYLLQDIIIFKYPFFAIYINYFFESLTIFKTIIIDLISTY